MSSATSLHVLVFGKDDGRLAVIRNGLAVAGHGRVTEVPDTRGLVHRVVAEDADLLLFDLGRPEARELDAALEIVRAVDRPVVIFVDASGAAATTAAMDAGVSAYIINDLRAERIAPVVGMAMGRFAAQKRLKDQLASTEQALRDRKVIDRAKGLLMSRKGLSEDAAYQLLRRTAMQQEKRLVVVAQSVVDAAGLLS